MFVYGVFGDVPIFVGAAEVRCGRVSSERCCSFLSFPPAPDGPLASRRRFLFVLFEFAIPIRSFCRSRVRFFRRAFHHFEFLLDFEEQCCGAREQESVQATVFYFTRERASPSAVCRWA
jgi:hypothetical protein